MNTFPTRIFTALRPLGVCGRYTSGSFWRVGTILASGGVESRHLLTLTQVAIGKSTAEVYAGQLNANTAADVESRISARPASHSILEEL